MTNNITVIIAEAGNPELKVVEQFEHSLETLQQFVGGYIEAIRVNESITIWINEEGKLNDLPPNFYLTDETKKPYDVVVGDAIITGTDEEGDTVSLTEDEIIEVKARFLSRHHFNNF